MNIEESVILNNFGYYQLKVIPSQDELNDYYAKKYYQEDKAIYLHEYSNLELNHIYNKIKQKEIIINEWIKPLGITSTLLDVGCGEGFTLSYYHKKSWSVKGIDYSSYGCELHNQEVLPFFSAGDVYLLLNELIGSGKKFDCIWLDNVLEHVVEPEELLKKILNISHRGTVLVVEVPNDFSVLQRELLASGKIDRPFWVVKPDHISYFNKEGLKNLMQHCGWNAKEVIGDFPIDFNLANPFANYVMDKETGKGAHQQRLFIDTLMHNISPELANKFYQSIAEMNLGRQISMFLMPE